MLCVFVAGSVVVQKRSVMCVFGTGSVVVQ